MAKDNKVLDGNAYSVPVIEIGGPTCPRGLIACETLL